MKEIDKMRSPIEGLIFNGIQKIPDEPDQYVFTDLVTGSTFFAKETSEETLRKERDRVRAKFLIRKPGIQENERKNI